VYRSLLQGAGGWLVGTGRSGRSKCHFHRPSRRREWSCEIFNVGSAPWGALSLVPPTFPPQSAVVLLFFCFYFPTIFAGEPERLGRTAVIKTFPTFWTLRKKKHFPQLSCRWPPVSIRPSRGFVSSPLLSIVLISPFGLAVAKYFL
jgi:hypothetical protein